MILRFRDLIDETINNHIKIIVDQGYVWWGWWSKSDEKIPRNIFSSFKDHIEKSAKGFLH